MELLLLLLLPSQHVQARGFAKARSSGSIETYTIAVSKAIVDEDDDDVVQVGAFAFCLKNCHGGCVAAAQQCVGSVVVVLPLLDSGCLSIKPFVNQLAAISSILTLRLELCIAHHPSTPHTSTAMRQPTALLQDGCRPLRPIRAVVQMSRTACSHLNSNTSLCVPCPAIPQAYGVAFAQAIAAGGDESTALAEATAIAFCQGGSTATAFAKAYAVALDRERNGCLVLTQVRALAVAKCQNGFVRTYADASVERKVLGFCGVLEQFGIFDNSFGNFNFDLFGKKRR